MERKRLSSSVGLDPDYVPVDCPILEGNDPIYAYARFFLATLFLTDFGTVPNALSLASSELGLEPLKLDLGNPVHRFLYANYRRFILSLCSSCPRRGECLWMSALRRSSKR